jgi:hypothetical protein
MILWTVLQIHKMMVPPTLSLPFDSFSDHLQRQLNRRLLRARKEQQQRVEGWKDGRVEGWKGGRVEGWKGGRWGGVTDSECQRRGTIRKQLH